MTDPTPLSPAAQAVLNAAGRRYAIDSDLRDSIAAALCAAVGQTVMRKDGEVWVCNAEEVLAIAAELEGADG